jgi:hypothetical protein
VITLDGRLVVADTERQISGLSQAIKGDVREIAGGVTVLQNQFLSQKMRDIVSWLSPLNFWSKQNDVFNTRLEGTGEWLLEHDKFKEWLSGTYRTLWCPGMRMTSLC